MWFDVLCEYRREKREIRTTTRVASIALQASWPGFRPHVLCLNRTYYIEYIGLNRTYYRMHSHAKCETNLRLKAVLIIESFCIIYYIYKL